MFRKIYGSFKEIVILIREQSSIYIYIYMYVYKFQAI